MNWLLTYCDGSSGYKTSRLLTPVGASLYLVEVGGLEKALADKIVNQVGRIETISCGEAETVLYPVPTEATDDPGLDDDES